MNAEQLISEVEQRLRTRFTPAKLTVQDESHLHQGHAGAAHGRHLRVAIAAPELTRLRRVEAHRALYAALGELMDSHIHALAIEVCADGAESRSLS